MTFAFKNTNNPNERVNFETALLRGMGSNYGLYTIAREDIPRLTQRDIRGMKGKSYADIAVQVLSPYIASEIGHRKLEGLLNDAYDESVIPTRIQHIVDRTNLMWLTNGPTYSFKDYAARFFGRTLNHFLEKRGLQRVVVVATSGDTGGAVADALRGLSSIGNIVFYPMGSISEGQRRQMTTLGLNVYAFEVNGDFDVCQALAKTLLGDKDFAEEVFKDRDRLTSANSISLGRLLPQAVYPFFAYSRVAENGEQMIASVPSGNFGDMMGTVVAKAMGLPISEIICGVNENNEFPVFLLSGRYTVKATANSPSSAMNVSHPSNLARLVDFYGGRMFDERDAGGKVIREGVIDKMPDMDEMQRDISSISITDAQHYSTMKEVYERFGIMLDPHGAVGWRALNYFLHGRKHISSVVYETADPGKFPNEVRKAIGKTPEIPERMKAQAAAEERIYKVESKSDMTEDKKLKLSAAQVEEAKQKISEIFR